MVASLELCKELFKLSGWEVPGYRYYYQGVDDIAIFDLDDESNDLIPSTMLDNKICPAYTAGFLLRKLPGHLTLTNEWAAGGWRAIFKPEGEMYNGKNQFVEAADTAEDALTKLTITLFNQKLIERSE